MNRRQMIDNYFERKEIIKQATKGQNDELPLDKLADKIKDEVSPGIYGNKNVSLVPTSSSPYLNHDEVKAGVTPAVWEKLKPFIKMRKASVALSISLVQGETEAQPEEYRKNSFKMVVEKLNGAK